MQLLLASASRYKASLLGRFEIPFETRDAALDETPRSGESAEGLARRLARSKAEVFLAQASPQSIVIGADQVASTAELPVLGKPGSAAANRDQLIALSGQTVTFFTAATVLGGTGATATTVMDRTQVRFRNLSTAEIDAYLRLEPAHDCAGGCKVEGLGITLLESVVSEDPTALVGLPLIALHGALRDHGLRLPITE